MTSEGPSGFSVGFWYPASCRPALSAEKGIPFEGEVLLDFQQFPAFLRYLPLNGSEYGLAQSSWAYPRKTQMDPFFSPPTSLSSG